MFGIFSLAMSNWFAAKKVMQLFVLFYFVFHWVIESAITQSGRGKIHSRWKSLIDDKLIEFDYNTW